MPLELPWKELHGRQLPPFPVALMRPSSSVLAIHAKLAARYAENKGWIDDSSMCPNPTLFDDTCDTELLQRFLCDSMSASLSSDSVPDSGGAEGVAAAEEAGGKLGGAEGGAAAEEAGGKMGGAEGSAAE